MFAIKGFLGTYCCWILPLSKLECPTTLLSPWCYPCGVCKAYGVHNYAGIIQRPTGGGVDEYYRMLKQSERIMECKDICGKMKERCKKKVSIFVLEISNWSSYPNTIIHFNYFKTSHAIVSSFHWPTGRQNLHKCLVTNAFKLNLIYIANQWLLTSSLL